MGSTNEELLLSSAFLQIFINDVFKLCIPGRPVIIQTALGLMLLSINKSSQKNPFTDSLILPNVQIKKYIFENLLTGSLFQANKMKCRGLVAILSGRAKSNRMLSQATVSKSGVLTLSWAGDHIRL